MPEPNATLQNERRRGQQALIFSLGLVLVLLLAACPLGVIAIQQRVISLPQLSVRLGSVEFSAPCPTRSIICDESTPWVAVWRGEDQIDGSVLYRQFFFMYLKPKRQR